MRISIYSLSHLYGVAEETYLRCCDEVMDALIDKIDQIISFPRNTEFAQIANNFNAYGKQFPNVVGCIDGTHLRVEIKCNYEKRCFKNYKKFHSIHLMAVCKDDLMFTYIFAGWPVK